MLEQDRQKIEEMFDKPNGELKNESLASLKREMSIAPKYLQKQKPPPAGPPPTRLYIQSMTTTNHNQNKRVPKALKKKANGQLDDIGRVQSQISFPVQSQDMFYCVRNLHQKPHGLAMQENWNAATISLDKANVAHKEVGDHWKTNKYFDENLKLLYSGSGLMAWFLRQQQENCRPALDKKWLKDFVIEHGISNGSRDVADEGKTNKRVGIGFGQNQKNENSLQLKCAVPDMATCVVENEDDLKMPTLNTTKLDLMLQKAPQVVEALAEILGFSQRCLESFYQKDETRPFSNEFRSKTFGNRLHSHFFPDEAAASEGPSFDWEYIDITVKNSADLPRHMDYMNDSRVGYNHCAVYSFIIDEYRVSIIMTTRCSVGSCADRLQHVFFNDKPTPKVDRDKP
eukprot:scaffold10972_cov59-Cylindrotheca_fusiformis.AAC.1